MVLTHNVVPFWTRFGTESSRVSYENLAGSLSAEAIQRHPDITSVVRRSEEGLQMRLGLVSDVHNHAVELARALLLFRDHAVEQVITIGDTCDAFGRQGGAAEVATLLKGCGAAGVWGNHDFSLCRNVHPAAQAQYGAVVLEFMLTMQPRLVVEDCLFSHKEASVDPFDVIQLWDVSDRPLDMMERASLAFVAATQRWQFVGHYHRWWAATPRGPLGWSGMGPLEFSPGERYFVVVAAVCDGWCGLLDTVSGVLQPLWCGPE